MMQLAPGKKLAHIVRYGTAADQKFLSGPLKDAYDVLAINANMMAHTPSSIYRFIKEKIPGKGYFIDPQTHAFQHGISYLQKKPNEDGSDIKTSLKKLIDAYGAPFTSMLSSSSSIRPTDVINNLDGFCQRVIDFQCKHLESSSKKENVDKYMAFLKKEGQEVAAPGPIFVVSPYFYLTPDNYDNWFSVNLICLRETIKKCPKQSVAMQIVISQDMLGSSKIDDMVKELKKLDPKPNLFLLWIDDFKEHEVSAELIEKYIEVCNKLTTIAPIVNLYGSFLSVVLGKNKIIKNLVGVGHGPEYGESRAVVPVGGGLPVSKYYFPPIHARLKFRDAVQAVMAVGSWDSKNKFHATVCDCKQCQLVIEVSPEEDFEAYGLTNTKVTMSKRGARTRAYPTSESKGVCVRHYMLCKKNEYTSNEIIELETAVKNLDKIRIKLERELQSGLVAHCTEWKNVLKRYI